MTCVLGMVVRREREIRSFVKTPFYRVIISLPVAQEENKGTIEAEWRSVEGSKYFQSPKLYKENGFVKRETAQELINYLETPINPEEKKPDCTLIKIEKKKEQKQPPLLFNLAELQNTCSRRFKISPDETLKIVKELYEKKMVTYPRTDARVLSTAVAKEISKNIRGLSNFAPVGSFAQEILSQDAWKTIAKTRYTNDKQITEHQAIIPTGQGLGAYERLSGVAKGVYEVICRRFLSIFYGPAVYKKYALEFQVKTEHFFTSYRMLEDPGYLKVTGVPQESTAQKEGEEEFAVDETSFLSRILSGLKKGMLFEETSYAVKEGETSPPKRYNSGSLNAKTQIIKPQKLGEAIYEVVAVSIKQLLNPELTASWEKGLTYVSEGTITSQEYMDKLQNFVARRTQGVKQVTNPGAIRGNFAGFEAFYETSRKS